MTRKLQTIFSWTEAVVKSNQKNRSSFLQFEKLLNPKKGKEPKRSKSDPFMLSEAELFGQLPQSFGPALFLDRLAIEDLKVSLFKTSFLSAMVQKGILKPKIEIQRVEPDEHRLLIFNEEEQKPVKWIELRLALAKLELPALEGYRPARTPFEMLAINWAMLQNPHASFSRIRPRLPGQEHPGLGLGRKCQEFLVYLSNELACAGLINHPQYFHNAVFYRDEYFFVDPLRQGELLAMIRDLAKYPVDVSSPAVADGKLIDARRRTAIEWHPEVMVCPTRQRLKFYFGCTGYRRAVEEAMKANSYDLAL